MDTPGRNLDNPSPHHAPGLHGAIVALLVAGLFGRPATAELAVSPTTPVIVVDDEFLTWEEPVIASDPEGRFLIAWETDFEQNQTDAGRSISARSYNPDGTARGERFIVHDLTQDPLEGQLTFGSKRSLLATAHGEFVLRWSSPHTAWGVSLDGALLTDPVSTGPAKDPGIAVGPAGGLGVFFEEIFVIGYDNFFYRYRFEVLDLVTGATSPPVTLVPYEHSEGRHYQLLVDPVDGTYVAAHAPACISPSGGGLPAQTAVVQHLTADGAVIGPEITLEPEIDEPLISRVGCFPRILLRPDGTFAAFWWLRGADDVSHLFGRLFGRAGDALAATFTVATPGLTVLTDMTMVADGTVFIAVGESWTSRARTAQALAFDESGESLGPTLRISELGEKPPDFTRAAFGPVATALTDDRVAVAWEVGYVLDVDGNEEAEQPHDYSIRARVLQLLPSIFADGFESGDLTDWEILPR